MDEFIFPPPLEGEEDVTESKNGENKSYEEIDKEHATFWSKINLQDKAGCLEILKEQYQSFRNHPFAKEVCKDIQVEAINPFVGSIHSRVIIIGKSASRKEYTGVLYPFSDTYSGIVDKFCKGMEDDCMKVNIFPFPLEKDTKVIFQDDAQYFFTKLLQLVKIIKPKVIVCFGAYVSKVVLSKFNLRTTGYIQKDSIMDEQMEKFNIGNFKMDIKIFNTIHPFQLLKWNGKEVGFTIEKDDKYHKFIHSAGKVKHFINTSQQDVFEHLKESAPAIYNKPNKKKAPPSKKQKLFVPSDQAKIEGFFTSKAKPL